MTDKELQELAAKKHPCNSCNAPRKDILKIFYRCAGCRYVEGKMPSKYAAEIGRVSQ